METLPVSTPQLPSVSATAGAESIADPGGATSTPQDGDFQALLSRSLAGLAHCAKGPAGAPGEEDCDATADTTSGDRLEGILTASDSTLALLAALPQAARPEVPGGLAAAGDVDGVGGERADDLRAEDLARPGARRARTGQGEPGLALTPDPEKTAERFAHGAEHLPEFKPAASHDAQAAIPAGHAPAAPHGADPAAAGPAPAAQRIETPLGAPGWSTALADRLVMFAGEKQQIAELHINPPHLGPLEITLTVSDDRATAVFVSPHAIVRETLEAALPRLREVLAESGINLGQASVTADSPRDGAAQAQSRSSFSSGGERAGAEDTSIGAAALAVARRARSLVDLFA